MEIQKLFKFNPLCKISERIGKEDLLTFARDCCRVSISWLGNWKGDHNSHRASFRSSNRNPKPHIKNKEQKSPFFSEFERHSEDIGKVIFDGFGEESNLFGFCDYQNGSLFRNDPKDPSIQKIGLARQHLQKGYPEIWDKKQKLEKEIIELYNSISETIKEFEQIIIQSIPNNFDARINIVSEKDPATVLPFYYQIEMFSYVFRQINSKFDGFPPTLPSFQRRGIHVIKQNRGIVTDQSFCMIEELQTLAHGERERLEDLRNICNVLIYHQRLNELVQQYRDMKTKISQLNISEFYKDVHKIWIDVYENGNNLQKEGACNHCPKHGFLDYF